MPFVRVHVAFRKWGDRPHWEMDMDRIGEDEYGVWLASGAGSQMSRPGSRVTFSYASAAAVSRSLPSMAFFHERDADARVAIYVDITTPPVWEGELVTLVDLDLDVVRGWDGIVRVLDEDEFAAHQQLYAYPAELVELAERSCADVYAAVEANLEPFATRGAVWLERYLAAG